MTGQAAGAVTVAAETVVRQPKIGGASYPELPEHVRRLPVPQRIAWLDSQEACKLLTSKARKRWRKLLRMDVVADVAVSGGGTLDVGTDPSMIALLSEGEQTATIERMRCQCRRGTRFGTRSCVCRYCHPQRALWPPVYVDEPVAGYARSYECYIERTEPDPAAVVKLTEAEAAKLGLRVCHKRPKRKAREVVPGCERCGGDRFAGDRYCPGCRREMIREMNEDGYLEPLATM